MPHRIDWEIPGAESQTLFGTTYQPDDANPIGCAIIAHGFKGYKDFRMIPPIAWGLCEAGFVAHTFNFSHSGMTKHPDTFERPELFQRDTWNKQVFDIGCIVEAIANGDLAGTGLPYVLVGHSRGGVSAILFAGRLTAESPLPRPVGVITAGTPDCACNLSETQKNELRERGYLASPSSRTGQILRVGLPWLSEQESDPAAHDVLANVGKIEVPLLVIHGEDDETVDVSNAESIAAAAKNARVVRINHCNHVFNTPNPPPTDFREVPELHQAVDEIVRFSRDCCTAR